MINDTLEFPAYYMGLIKYQGHILSSKAKNKQ